MRSGDRLRLRAEKAVAGGRMLARHEGAVVLVAAALPGETVTVEIERIQHGTIWAVTRTVLEPSPDRVEPFCDWACGGSAYAHVKYERQLALKADVLRDAFARIARFPLEEAIDVKASPTDGYRMRARLHFRGGRLGFFRAGTHELCDAAATRQLLPETVRALEGPVRALADVGVARSDLAVAENREATDRALHLELDSNSDPSRLGSITKAEGITGISCSVGPHRRALTLLGSPLIGDTIGGIRLSRHARVFFQGNRYLLADLVAHVCANVPAGRVGDLYSGVGLFATALAARGEHEVSAVEGDAVAADALKRNIAPYAAVAKARHQSVELFVSSRRPELEGATIVVDPPRTGMSKEALAGMLALRPARIVYVSCDVATLARDVRSAIDRGYRLAALTAFDMFPNTAHVETVAILDA